MVADLRKMQENQGVSENRIDKSRFVLIRCFSWCARLPVAVRTDA